jgi:predicted TPR repeat methyltransferase
MTDTPQTSSSAPIPKTTASAFVDVLRDVKGVFNTLKSLPIKQKFRELVLESEVVRKQLDDLPGTNYELGVYHFYAGNFRDAAMRFKFALKLKPNAFPEASYYFGMMELYKPEDEQDIGQAKTYFKQTLQHLPNHELARFALDRLENPETIRAVPLTLIKRDYDNIAADYDRMFLEDLHYRAHRELWRAVDETLGDVIKRMRIADIGCGTGLCGQGLQTRGFVRVMDGIDISPKMLEEARKRKYQGEPSYDRLIEQDLVSYLVQDGVKSYYDLVSACSVLHYLGDLKPAFHAIHQALTPEGLFAFSLETASDIKEFRIYDDMNYFRYNPQYVDALAKQCGFVTVAEPRACTLYDEAKGHQFIYRKA